MLQNYLTGVEARVERSVTKIIEKAIISFGYLPEKEKSEYDKTEDGYNRYKEDCRIIKDAIGFYIPIFGPSSQQAKGELTYPRIVIQPVRAMMGDIGTPVTTKVVDAGVYNVYKHPYSTSNLQLDIKLIWKTIEHYRVMNEILSYSLSTRNYIKFHDADDADFNIQSFFIENLNTGYDVSNSEQGLTESMVNYQITDLYLSPPKVLAENQPLISAISVVTEVNKIIDGNDNLQIH